MTVALWYIVCSWHLFCHWHLSLKLLFYVDIDICHNLNVDFGIEVGKLLLAEGRWWSAVGLTLPKVMTRGGLSLIPREGTLSCNVFFKWLFENATLKIIWRTIAYCINCSIYVRDWLYFKYDLELFWRSMYITMCI